MNLTRRKVLAAGAATLSTFPARAATMTTDLIRFGAVPSPRQAQWHKLETYGFVHFTINTFTDREWGYGDESPSLFNPSDFSADQIAGAAVAGGLKAIILTAKHHDGFCLWPSAHTEHSIKASPYKGGTGDIVREISDACVRHGLQFGLYLSPWDRNHAQYGADAYVQYYHNQLQELMTQYGRLFTVWFDGANGGDGYYGGAREHRLIDGKTYYKWDRVRAIVRKNQPDAVMFADAHMDIRWVGNEEGHAGDPCWPTVDATPFTKAKGNSGTRNGELWNPAETDVSIRPGWFWHADEKPRTAANLMRIYFESVGRGTNLLLNMAPDRRGRVPDADVRELAQWKALRDKLYTVDLAKDARVTASSVHSPKYTSANLLSPTGYWAARASDTSGAWVEVALPKARTFDVIRLAEDIALGARVDTFAVDIREKGQWRQVAENQCIAYKRLVTLAEPVTTDGIRIRFVKVDASPVVGQFALYLRPVALEAPLVTRDQTGLVTMKANDPRARIHYTINGTVPTEESSVYSHALSLQEGGRVQAITRLPSGMTSDLTSIDFDISPKSWIVLAPTESTFSEAKFSATSGGAFEVIFDLQKAYVLKGFTLTPGTTNPLLHEGPPASYRIWVSDDTKVWGTPVKAGEFSNIANNRAVQTIGFDRVATGRYVRLVLPTPVPGSEKVAFQSFGILTR